ncbi:MAG: hypothetical protein ABIG28_01155 [archaeon]
MILRKGGWQCNVEYHRDYVIKRRKSYGETKRNVALYFLASGKLSGASKESKRVQDDYDKSLKILKKSKVSLELLGNPIFNGDAKFRKDRAVVLKNAFKNISVEEARRILDKYFDLVLEL